MYIIITISLCIPCVNRHTYLPLFRLGLEISCSKRSETCRKALWLFFSFFFWEREREMQREENKNIFHPEQLILCIHWWLRFRSQHWGAFLIQVLNIFCAEVVISPHSSELRRRQPQHQVYFYLKNCLNMANMDSATCVREGTQLQRSALRTEY